MGAGGPCLSRDVFVAIVSRNVLSCLLNVPAAGPWAYKCFRSLASRPVSGPDYPPLAVFCMDCGYCLNFGKQTGVGGQAVPHPLNGIPTGGVGGLLLEGGQ